MVLDLMSEEGRVWWGQARESEILVLSKSGAPNDLGRKGERDIPVFLIIDG